MKGRVLVALGAWALMAGGPLPSAAETAGPSKTCMSSVCLGDGLDGLEVRWAERTEEAVASYRKALKRNPFLPDQRRAQYHAVFPAMSDGDVERLLPYKDAETAEEDLLFLLDSWSLDVLATVSRVCAYLRLEGRFISKSGYPTTVTFRPRMVGETTDGFVVARIRRDYPLASQNHKAALLADLEDRFGPLMTYSEAVVAARKGVVGPFFRIDGGILTVTLYDPALTVINDWRTFAQRRTEMLAGQPYCRTPKGRVPLD